MTAKPRSIVSKQALRTLAAALAIGLLWPTSNALAQATPAPASQSASVLPTGGGAALLDPSDSVFLLLDHQAGLFQTVKDIGVVELRANTVMLAKLATLLKIPVITTASEPNGPNGPLMPEINQSARNLCQFPQARAGEGGVTNTDTAGARLCEGPAKAK